MSEAAVSSFPSYSYSDIFGMTGGSVLILVMTACGNFAFNGFYLSKPHFSIYSFS